MDVEYLDFELEIGAGDNVVYPLSVVHSPAGVMRAEFQLTLGQIELENRLLALQNALLRSGGVRRTVLTREEQTVRTFGMEMFDALFRDDVRALYRESKRTALSQGKGLRLKLRISSPQLAALPWEYLFDERDREYVCLSQGTPLVRFLEVAQPVRPLTVTGPLRILAMVASPRGLEGLNVEVEKERLERALGDLRAAGSVELTWLNGQTWRDLQQEMRLTRGPWHIFHYIGHGGFDTVRDEGFLAVTDRQGDLYPLMASQLGRLLADHRSLRLVLLNACESAQAGRTDIFSSAAATLVLRGVPAVIAMQYAITDQAAIEFAEQFYDSLADGLPVDTAVTEARKTVSLAINNTLEWGIPVLFMQAPDGVLFEVAEGEPADEPTVEIVAELVPDVVEPSRPTSSKRLSGEQLKELHAAMLDAYTSESDLRRMVRFELDENLSVIAAGGDLSEKMFNLIDWSERTGRLMELVEKAHQYNPGNARLRAFAASLPGVAVVAEEAITPAQQRATEPTSGMTNVSSGSSKSPWYVNFSTMLGMKARQILASPIDFDWVMVPAGEFIMGSDKQKDSMALVRETPQHKLILPEYCIARVPVTNVQYKLFVTSIGHRAPWHWQNGEVPRGKDDHPVINVDWHDAQAFSKWANVRLPTEAEWEKAARGTDGRIWPWGDEPPTDKHCNFKQNVGDTTQVGSYTKGASPYDLLDMAGNVDEWTNSLFKFKSYPYDPDGGSEDPGVGGSRTFRGGSCHTNQKRVRCASRDGISPDWRSNAIGFRVARLEPTEVN